MSWYGISYCKHYAEQLSMASNRRICKLKQDKTGNGEVDEKIYERYCCRADKLNCPVYSKLNSSDCFLTTACVTAKGLPNDCRELTVLRAFRDFYLSEQDGGKDEIAEYYRIAPAIVNAINAASSSTLLWEELYANLIIPCVNLIEEGNNAAAYELYRSYVKALSERYLIY